MLVCDVKISNKVKLAFEKGRKYERRKQAACETKSDGNDQNDGKDIDNKGGEEGVSKENGGGDLRVKFRCLDCNAVFKSEKYLKLHVQR